MVRVYRLLRMGVSYEQASGKRHMSGADQDWLLEIDGVWREWEAEMQAKMLGVEPT
jgi:hypothetical protein